MEFLSRKITMNNKLALGIDIGGTNTAFGLVDEKGVVIFHDSIPTRDYNDAALLIDEIYRILHDTEFSQNIIGIGIGAPNGNAFSGSIEFAPNLKWKGIIPIAKMFASKFNIPSYLTNDANAAALGEKIYGAAKDLEDFVSITLGTGLGSGVIVNGQLVYGSNGLAGEYGHIRVVHDGRDCGCGRKGCLETYASSTGIVRSIDLLDSPNKSTSILNLIKKPTAIDIFNSAEKGDKFSQEIIDFTAEKLGNALADFACFSNPEAYILFGGIAQSGEGFRAKVQHHMDEGLLPIYKGIEVRLSKLHGDNAAILGASSIVWSKKDKIKVA